MESVWMAMLAFLGVYTFAIVSPGPNFLLVTNTAMTGSRRDGLLVAFGVATGSGIFACAGLAGLLPLVHSLPHFAEITRYVGGGYLLWLGFNILRSCTEPLARKVDADAVTSSALARYRVGLITNLTNPKAWAFYLSLFALFIGTPFPLWSKGLLNLAMFLISLAWYSFMALLISSRTFQPFFLGVRPFIQGTLGVLLIVAAGKILWG